MRRQVIIGIGVALWIVSATFAFAESAPMLSTFTNLSAEADPHTGSANFGIPIQVVPGRGGLEPNLALQYNSSSPNGIIGVGWNLEIGQIRRSTKDGVPTYNNSTDTFVLVQNGSAQELIYDSAAGVYRPKLEGNFLRISSLIMYGACATVTGLNISLATATLPASTIPTTHPGFSAGDSPRSRISMAMS